MSNKIALFFLFSVLTLLCFQNYTPGTFLAGWDNLMPELNIWLNLKRSLFAVWQEYQGLGLVGGMAHATDLIRQLILLPFTLILPLNLIRYLWHFAMLFLGTFGIYFGLKNNFKFKKIIIFAASLFYLLNFGTIQYFWNPLETFSTFWGFFPWLIFSLWAFLNHNSKSNLKKFILWNILAIPAFYVQTIFIVYLICLFLILFSYFLISKEKNFSARSEREKLATSPKVASTGKIYSQANRLKESLKIFSLIFLINSFWLLPQIYFLSGNLQHPTNGIGNFMSNDDTFARNLARGNLADFLLLRGYYFDFPNNSGQLMSPWIAHLSNQYYLLSGYFLSFFIILGLVYLLKKRRFIHLSLFALFLLSALSLLTNVWPFSQLNQVLRQFPLVNQIFRSPWTKFLVPAAFSFSLISAFGLHYLSRILAEIKYSRRIQILPSLFFISLLFIFSYPAFTGNFISNQNRQNIPATYFQLQNYFQKQPPSARIANLPQGSFWGWTNYRWGYTGSGFLWYLLPQPILDRAFDAWNLKNEQYYWQLSTAIQQKDPILIQNLLDKYQIEFIIFDHSIYFPDDKIFSKNSLATSDLLQKVPGLTLDTTIDHLDIYRYHQSTAPFLTNSLTTITPFPFSYHDPAFNLLGDYLNHPQSTYSFPFTSLFTNRLQSELNFQVGEFANSLEIVSGNSKFYLAKDESINFQINSSALISPYQEIINQDNQQFYRLSDQKHQSLFVLNFPQASLSRSYLVEVKHRHLKGLPLELSIVSENIQNKYLHTNLPEKSEWQTSWFILPARQSDNFDSGINLIFLNKSLNQQISTNDVLSASLYPIPYFPLISQNNLPNNIQKNTRTYLNFKNHLFYYQIKNIPQSKTNQQLILPQSYDPGWLAFYFSCKGRLLCLPFFHLLPSHLLANNWANSWPVRQICEANGGECPSIHILFWPQMLEFFGLLLIPLTLILTFKKSKN